MRTREAFNGGRSESSELNYGNFEDVTIRKQVHSSRLVLISNLITSYVRDKINLIRSIIF